ncbi:MAG: hypothetical protein ACM3U0_02140 [archaeon]
MKAPYILFFIFASAVSAAGQTNSALDTKDLKSSGTPAIAFKDAPSYRFNSARHTKSALYTGYFREPVRDSLGRGMKFRRLNPGLRNDPRYGFRIIPIPLAKKEDSQIIPIPPDMPGARAIPVPLNRLKKFDKKK